MTRLQAVRPASLTLLIAAAHVAACVADAPQNGRAARAAAAITWVDASPLNQPRWLTTGTVLSDGRLLAAGGRLTQQAMPGATVSTAEMFDPTSRTWLAAGSMTEPRFGHAAALLADGTVIVAGGEGDLVPALSTAEIFDPKTSSWSKTGAMPAARRRLSLTTLKDAKVLAVGDADVALLYDPASRSWSPVGGPITRRIEHTATLLDDGSVLVAGGESAGAALSLAELFSSGKWERPRQLLEPRARHVAVKLRDGRVLLAGGKPERATIYDPAIKTFSQTDTMVTAPRNAAAITLLPSGRVLVTGGSAEAAGWASTAEVFEPSAGDWVGIRSFREARAGHVTAMIPSGQVLVAGGWGSGSTVLSSTEIATILPNGAACTESDACESGHCSFGVCCNEPCAGACQTCAASGAEGKCTAVTGAPPAARPGCGGLACNEGACRSACSEDAHCAPGGSCRNGGCVGAVCAPDASALVRADGSRQNCDPGFACVDGACRTFCNSTSDCTSGFACDVSARRCVPAAAPETDDGSCSMVRRRAGGGSAAGPLLAMIAMLALRRRAR